MRRTVDSEKDIKGYSQSDKDLGNISDYDKFLSAEPKHPTVALCYDFQLVEAIPTDAYDIPVDLVLVG